MDSLGSQVLQLIFSCLEPKWAARAACVQRLWRTLIHEDESFWQRNAKNDFGCEQPVGPNRITLSSYRQAYYAWQMAFPSACVDPILVGRVARMWNSMRSWLKETSQEVLDSLQEGVSNQELDEAEQQLGHSFPLALRLMYRMCGGQKLQFDEELDRNRSSGTYHRSIFHGLLGGYSFYDHIISCRMMTLKRMVLWTQFFRSTQSSLGPTQVVFGASFRLDKLVLVDLTTGDVAVTARGSAGAVRLPGTPPGASGDGVLRWMEEFTHRCLNGVYGLSRLDTDAEVAEDSWAICLFPQAEPWMSTAVTRGVKVQASSLLVPELCRGNLYHFAYSVRFSLVREEEQGQTGTCGGTMGEEYGGEIGPRVMSSCQLQARHWIIRNAADEVVDEVRGAAVVGHYPLLIPGGEPFIYQSCTQIRSERRGSMEGDFTFVPGSLAEPTGEAFEAACPRFTLEVPEFVF